MSAPAAKKAKTAPAEDLHELTFASVTPLVNVVHAITNLSPQIALRVGDDCITSQAVASSKSCMVNAKLHCGVSGGAGSTFSVDSRTLLRALKSIGGNNHVIHLQFGDDTVVLRAIDDVTRTCAMEWTIPTIVSDVFSVELDKIEYCGEWLYDAKTLKTDIVRCREMDCDDTVTLRLLKLRDGGAGAKCVELRASGSRGSVCIQHRSKMEPIDAAGDADGDAAGDADGDAAGDADGDAAGDAAGTGFADSAGYDVEYEQQYCVTSMSEFLRCTDSSSLKLLLGHEQPLIVEVPLVGDGSQMCFVQGPHAEE